MRKLPSPPHRHDARIAALTAELAALVDERKREVLAFRTSARWAKCSEQERQERSSLMRACLTGTYRHSPETRAKMSAQAKERYSKQEVAFGRPRAKGKKPPRVDPSPKKPAGCQAEFRHLRRAGTPDTIPPIPLLLSILGVPE